MNMQNPISDMFSIIRNGQFAKKSEIFVNHSKIKESILSVLLLEGFIKSYSNILRKKKKIIKIQLKYFKKKPVIEKIYQVSKPSLRIYKNKNSIPKILEDMGIAILSTNQGIMTNKKAKMLGIGGEVICYVI